MKGSITIAIVGILASLVLYRQAQKGEEPVFVAHVLRPERAPLAAIIRTPGAVAGVSDTPVNQETDDATIDPSSVMVDLAAKPVAVEITANGFAPSAVTIPVGGAVTWTNNDPGYMHEVLPSLEGANQDKWQDVGAGKLAPQGTYTFIFSTPGVYTYADGTVPGHAGTITVQE